MDHILLFLLSAAACVGFSAAQCTCAPEKWSGRLTQSIALLDNQNVGTGIILIGNLTYDFPSNKVAVLLQNTNPGELPFRQINDYTAKKMYRYDPDAALYCTILPLIGELVAPCESNPPTSSMILGSASDSLKANTFAYDVNDDLVTAQVAITSTTKACIPVGLAARGVYNSTTRFLINQGFFDITPGIQDPSVLEIPAICKSAGRVYKKPAMEDALSTMGWQMFR